MAHEATGAIPGVGRLPDRSLKIMRMAALLLVAAALAYLGFAIDAHWRQLSSFDWSQVSLGMLAISSVAYGISLVTTALAWPAILRSLGEYLRMREALAIGLTAQIGKYVPGNVAHYMSRAALARRAHVTFRQSGASTILEFTSAVLAALIVAAVALSLSTTGIRVTWEKLAMTGAAASALVVATSLAVNWLSQARLPLSAWIRPVLWLIASFILAGFSIHIILVKLGAAHEISPLVSIGLYAIAWTAGFVIPGAPAGLGVREAVLVGSLAGLVGAPSALVAAALHRLLTAGTDGIVSLVGIALLTLPEKGKASL
jgi:glycosyltransferase 2 family protein